MTGKYNVFNEKDTMRAITAQEQASRANNELEYYRNVLASIIFAQRSHLDDHPDFECPAFLALMRAQIDCTFAAAVAAEDLADALRTVGQMHKDRFPDVTKVESPFDFTMPGDNKSGA